MLHQQLFKKIFQKNITDSESMDMLRQSKNEYPYFGAAHFFLLQKTDVNAADYENTAATTALHFGNPFLLNYHLTKKEDHHNIVQDNYTSSVEVQTNDEAAVYQEQTPNLQQQQTPEQDDPEKETPDNLPVEKIPEVENTGELIFEPLYTTDYFASQGIKLSEEIQPTDKLGKQLKSFTEWLKTMKKVHESRLPEGNQQLDATVQSLAEKSNKEDQIVTEAMADAYLQQGKKAKAIDIYLKLSLLNPAKSAFFAAKIEQLKEK